MEFSNNPLQELDENIALLESTGETHKLVLHNDDFNTFDFVIKCLIKICNHTLEQAEQCTILVHYRGKCIVKEGNLEYLEPMHQKLLSHGLTSEII